MSRYFRDAKVMEIIEGSTQIQQFTIARFEFQELSHDRPQVREPHSPGSRFRSGRGDGG